MLHSYVFFRYSGSDHGMKQYTWVIEVSTGQECIETDYDKVAGEMCNVLVDILTNTATMQGLTASPTWESCCSEIEVSYTGEAVVGAVVVDIKCAKASVTKPKLLALMRETAPQWPNLTVTKRSA
jgi:hypothetical protein